MQYQQYKPNVVFIEVVQTWYGRESLHCFPTAFLLRPYYVSYVTTSLFHVPAKAKVLSYHVV